MTLPSPLLTVHHWSDWRSGLAELRRIAPLQVVLAYEVCNTLDFWLVRDYIPEIAAVESNRPTTASAIAEELGTDEVIALPVAHDCIDGVLMAHWRRPHAYLDPTVRRNCSALAQTDPHAVERGIRRLRDDLASGRWHERHADLLERDSYDGGYCLVVGRAKDRSVS